MMRTQSYTTAAATLVVLLCGASTVLAQTAPSLGDAGSFAVLGNTTVTNTGSSVITGDVGVHPGTSVTGFPPGLVTGGNIDRGGASALAAQTATTTAANSLLGQACTTNSGPGDVNIGNQTFTPGVHCFASSISITGPVTLNGQGNANAVFIFRSGSTLITATASSVVLINGAQACNVFWRVGSSATLGTSTSFVGNILARTSITANTSATVSGRLLAQDGAVTLDSNTVTRSTCATTGGGGSGGTCPVITLAPPTLPNATSGVAYSQTITAGNGLAADTTYTYRLVGSGALPPGLSLSSAGVISGMPLASGTGGVYNFEVRATNPSSCSGVAAYTMMTLTAVPTLPQVFTVMLGFGLLVLGYMQLQRRRSAI
ncbi:MAG: ice-binding family protein [Acidobacteriota bacterium]|nr:ice-binding family protein [Acidobacteriota bacterium]